MDVVSLTKQLIEINSENPPGNEKEIAKFIYDYLVDLEISSSLIKIEKNRFNVIGYKGKENGIMFNGHMDTVPAGNIDNWKYEPFSGKIVKNRLYGLGASDMKGSLGAMLIAIKNMQKQKFKRKLLLSFVADEEVGLKGSIHLIKKRRDLLKDVKYGVIGEPTELNICIANKGILEVKVKFFGKAAHGSRPWLGDNAILKASKFIESVKRLPHSFNRDPLLGRGTINVGKISGGTKVNVVPDFCEVEIDRRLVTGETPKAALMQIKRLLKKIKISAKIEAMNARFPFKIDKKSEIVKMIRGISGSKLISTAGYNEAELYYREAGIECVVFGPGTLSCIHAPNEYIEITKLKNAVRIYEGLIKKWCV